MSADLGRDKTTTTSSPSLVADHSDGCLTQEGTAVDEMSVRGRGLVKPAALVLIDAGRVFVRVDDEYRPDYWFELTIPAELVLNWADQVEKHRSHVEEDKQ